MTARAWAQASSLVTRRFGDSARMRAAWPWRPLRHGVLWASTWLALAGGLGRVDGAATAVVCLEPPRLRQAPRLVAVLVGCMAAGAGAARLLALLWPPLVVALALGLLGFCVRARWASWRDRSVAVKLRKAKPEGGWLVHNFAGDATCPGAGRVLLDAVCADADARRRVLYLDTVVPRLVEYYRQAGFEVAVSVPAVYAGEAVVVTRMVRRPG